MNFYELPMFIHAQLLARALVVSPPSAYEPLLGDCFPWLRIGNRLVAVTDPQRRKAVLMQKFVGARRRYAQRAGDKLRIEKQRQLVKILDA